MERTAWTDDRLDDLSTRIDTGFQDLRAEMRDMRADMRHMESGLRAEIDALRGMTMRVGGGMMVGLVGVIAAILARGV